LYSSFGARDAAPTTTPPPGAELRPAAFFGLDKTLIPGSSLMLLAQGLHERDFYGRRDIVRFAYRQLLFRFRRSEASPHFESSTQAALEFVVGRPRIEIRALAQEIAGAQIVPSVYRDMAMLIDQHRDDGIATFVTTAAPVELAEIVADGLGMTGALGTRAEVDHDERYTGRLSGSILHGDAKASAVRDHAAEAGIDLTRSAAYSDSINDLPLLELVGRPEAVNPDRRLRKVADQRGWPVRELRGTPMTRRRRTAGHVIHRLGTLGLQSPLQAEPGQVSHGPIHRFTVEDPAAFVGELEATGRFRRDTRLGGVFHRGKISLREVAPVNSLHITVEGNNRVSAHVDRYSPLAKVQPDEGPRYSLPRIAAHNITGMAAEAARLIPGRRRPRTCAEPPRVPRRDERHEETATG
jgi:HAD superfamily hydrolase (TIGR01490 family)